MTYLFAGFFGLADESVMKQALEQWPFCSGKLIKSPFEGIGIFCPQAKAKQLENELPNWSINFQSISFILIQVECFGGACDYSGYVCQNGNIILQEDQDNDKTDEARLLSLLRYLGVAQTNFEPFHRGFFDNT